MGLAGIEKDKTRLERIKALPKSKESEIIRMTLEETPKGCTHWTPAFHKMASQAIM